MINKLISLVVLIFILSIGQSYSDDQFLFPKEKPSIFKKIDRNITQSSSENLPQKKPLINKKQEQEKEVVVKNEIKTKEKKGIKRVETVLTKSSFVFPQKKTCYL
jgi:K+-transporting ATPase c subunit